jgi:hypothetical protein
MHPNHRQRLESLKKVVKSLAVVAVLVTMGTWVGMFLGGHYFAPTIKPTYVNGVREYVCGLAVVPGIMAGGFLGLVGGTVAGAYIARRAWWKTPQSTRPASLEHPS